MISAYLSEYLPTSTPSSPPAPQSSRRRSGALQIPQPRARQALAPPSQVFVPSQRSRRPSGMRSPAPRPVIVAPAQASVSPIYSPPPLRHPRQVLARVRGRAASPVPIVVAPIAPAYPPQTPHRLRFAMARLRGRAGTPVPAQVVVAAPAKVPQPSRRLTRAIAQIRGRASRFVVVQDYVLPRQRKTRVPWVLRRGKASGSPQAVFDFPQLARKASKIIALLSRRRTPRAQQPVVPAFPPRSIHHPMQAVVRRRGRSSTPVPPQVVSPVAPYVPKPIRIIRQFLTTFRHRWTGTIYPAPVTPPDVRAKFGLPETKWFFANPPGTTEILYRAPIDVGLPETKWELGAVAESPFVVGLPETKWVIEGGVLLLALSQATLEYVRVPVFASVNGQPVNPVAYVVQMAFLTSDTASPSSGDWVAASWDTAVNPITTYVAQCLVGTGGTIALPVGFYYVWIKVTASPEAPVRSVGTLQITI